MAIEGPLRELGIHDVFQLLDLSRKTGTLRVFSELRDNAGTVLFENGKIISAAIRSNPHRIGDLLVRSGRLSAARLDDSVRKLLAAKVRLNLHQRRMVDLDALPDALDTPEDQALAAETARRAITVIRNPAGLLPLKNPARACLFVLPPTRTSTLGEAFAAAIAEASPKMRVETLSPQLTPAAIAAAVKTAASCETVVAAYAAYNAAYPQRAALAGNYPALIEKLQSAGRPLALVALGNPYPLRHFPALPALVSFSTVPLSEEAAARALLGLAPISGVMPVSLPPPPAR